MKWRSKDMKSYFKEINSLYGKTYELENLIELLEDYFYEYKLDQKTYEKNQILCTVIKEKITSLDEEMDKFTKRILKEERGKENDSKHSL